MKKVKVAIAQISYKPCFCSGNIDYLVEPFGDSSTNISTISFSGNEKMFSKYRTSYITWLKSKILNIISYCLEKNVDILAFPEYSIPAELLIDIEKNIVGTKINIIAGTHIVSNRSINLPDNYPNLKNLIGCAICPIIDETGLCGYSVKNNTSQWEVALRIPDIDIPAIHKTPKCNIIIKICIDALTEGTPNINHNCGILIVPSYSPSTSPFSAMAHYAKYNEIPTLYINASKIGGSSIYAAFSENDPHWFISVDHTTPVPKNTECVIISDLNLDEMYSTKGTTIPHCGAQIDQIACIYYRQNKEQKDVIEAVEELLTAQNKYDFNEISKLHLDPLTDKKVSWLKKRNGLGLLIDSELHNTLAHIQINQPTFDDFITQQAKAMLKSLCGNIDNILSEPNALNNISILTNRMDTAAKEIPTKDEQYSADENLFIGRSREISAISSFFSSSDSLMVCQGLRGIGKSKLMDLVKPRIIPQNSRFTIIKIGLTSGSGYDYFVDELFYVLNSTVNDATKREPSDAANLLVACLSRFQNCCIIIDDFHYLLNQDNSFCDDRTSVFLDCIFSKINGLLSKFIFTSNRRINLYSCKNLNISRLEDADIKWIIRYCFQNESRLINVEIDQQTIDAIHGNPLAAIIVAQLIVEKKTIPLPENKTTFQRFEEQFIKNLIGELRLSENEEKILEILATSNIPMEIEFVRCNYAQFVSSIDALTSKFLVDIDNDTVAVHPLILDYFRNRVDVIAAAEWHKQYALYLETKYQKELTTGVPNPQLISQMIFHYAGSIDFKKLHTFKGKYIDQLKPIAELLFKEHKYEEAAEYYLLIYKTSGDMQPNVILRLAQSYVYTNKLSKAESFFSIATKKKPRAAYLYAKYAISLAHKYENAAMAEAYALMAEDIYRENSNTFRWELAEIKFAQAQAIRWNDKSKARSLYEESCNIDPSNCYYLCTYSRRLLKDGYIKKARDYYDRSNQVNPEYRGNASLKQLLDSYEQEKTLDQIDDHLDDTEIDFEIDG